MTLSYSKLQEFKNCSKKYSLKRIEKLVPINTSNQNELGILCHWTIAKKIQDMYSNVKYIEPRPREISYSMQQEASCLIEKCDIQAFFLNSKPISIEKKFSLKISDTLTIEGKIDLVLYDSTSDMYEVVDWKFGRVTSSIEDDDQSFFYALLVLEAFNLDRVRVIKNFVRFNDTPSKVFTRDELMNFKKYLQEMENAIVQLEHNDSLIVPRVTDRCTTCEMKKYCKHGQKVECNIEDITENIMLLEAETKRLKGLAKKIAIDKGGLLDTSRGLWNFTFSESFVIPKNSLSNKSDVVKNLLKNHPELIDSADVDLKIDEDISALAKQEFGISFNKRKTQRFVFKSH